MKAICENELVLDCTDYKAIDSGVVLIDEGEEGSAAIGFVPNEKLEYVLPDDVVEREYERLGLPAPTIHSPGDLEARLETFAGEIDDLREHLDRQVEELIDEGTTVGDEGERAGEDGAQREEDYERRERLRERRRTIDRLLEQVRRRSQQLRQLSTTETEATGDAAGEGTVEDPTATEVEDDAAESEDPALEAGTTPEDLALEAGATTAERIASLESEMDERFGAIEAQLQELVEASKADGDDSAIESSETEAAGESEAKRETENRDRDAETPLEPGVIHGLGSTYASRLEDAGIESLETLAERSPAEVAEAADVREQRARTWIDRATTLLDEDQPPT